MSAPPTEPVPAPEGLLDPSDAEAPVVLYTTPWCGFCRAALQLLRERDIEFVQVDVSERPDARQWLVRATRQHTVPQIFVRGHSIGGYTELAALDRSGELDRMLAAG